jgi:hypothetical protein
MLLCSHLIFMLSVYQVKLTISAILNQITEHKSFGSCVFVCSNLLLNDSSGFFYILAYFPKMITSYGQIRWKDQFRTMSRGQEGLHWTCLRCFSMGGLFTLACL